MYNGIGLTTPRGTGTNGYVQKNLSFVPSKRERVEYVKDVELKRLEKLIEKKGNAEILEHERKRKIEVKCMEMREMMLNTGYDEATTEEKVKKFRKMLVEREGLYEKVDIEKDEQGRPIAKETHQEAQANDEKNRRLREAFGIHEYNKKDAEKKKIEEAKEAEKKKAELVNKKYTIIPDEPEPEVRREPSSKEKDDEKDDDEDLEKEREQATSSKDTERSKAKEDRHHRHHEHRHHKSRDDKKRKPSPSNHKDRSTHKHSKKHREERSDDEREEKSRHHRRHRDRSSSRD